MNWHISVLISLIAHWHKSCMTHHLCQFIISTLTLKLYDTSPVLLFAYNYNLMLVIYQYFQVLWLMITCCLVTVLLRHWLTQYIILVMNKITNVTSQKLFYPTRDIKMNAHSKWNRFMPILICPVWSSISALCITDTYKW